MGNRSRTFAVLLAAVPAVLAAGCLQVEQPNQAHPVPRTATWPGDIAVPVAAPALPDDRAVGPAVAAYRADANARDVYLVTESGDQYSVPILGPSSVPMPRPTSGVDQVHELESMPVDPMYGLKVSPDGRWLIRTDWDRGPVLRDLAGTATIGLDRPVRPMLWSPDGHLLLLDVSAQAKSGRAILEPAANKRTEIAADVCGDGFSIRMLFDDGKLLCAPQRTMEDKGIAVTPGTEVFRVAAAAGGYREFTVDLREQIKDRTNLLAPAALDGAGNLAVMAFDATPRLFLVSAADGRLVREVRLPDEKVEGYEVWAFGGFDGDRVLAVRQVEIGSPTPVFEPTRVARLDPDGGAPEVVATFPRKAVIVLKGTMW